MNHGCINARAANYSRCGVLAVLVISVCAAKDRPERVNLFPRLQPGQVLNYQVSYHSDKRVKTDSSVIVAIPNDSAKIDVSALLRLEVLGVDAKGGRGVIRARTNFEALRSDSHFNAPQFEPPAPQLQQDSGGKFIAFTILSDGRMDQVTGLDALSPEQQQAWQEWASRFLLAAGLGSLTGRIAQKWKSEEAEKSASPVAGIRWMRESTYVRDEPCRPVRLTVQGSVASSDADTETCAVLLSTAKLRQDSNAKNATPEDYKLHELRTAGTASGSNRIITYISLQSGLLVRATEEATQQMNVTVTKVDASNRVRYDIKAKSHSEVLRVSETALTGP
jgi:hypothetical protein